MSLREQLRLESDLVLQGIYRYNKQIQSAEEQGRGSDTGYGQRLISSLVLPVAQGIQDHYDKTGARRHGAAKKYTEELDNNVLAYIGLKAVLDSLHKGLSVTKLSLDIGGYVEDELRFSKFKDINPEYFKALEKDFARKNTKSYRHIRNVLSVTSNKKGYSWKHWDKETKLRVGAMLIDIVLGYTDIVQVCKERHTRGRNIMRLRPTDTAMEWIEKFNDYQSTLHPYTKPCVIPPDEWTGLRNGGYWSEDMRHRTPLMIGMTANHEGFANDHDMSEVYEAVNAVQNTPWAVNDKVLEVMEVVWERNLGVGMPQKEPIEIPRFHTDMKPEDMDGPLKEEFKQYKAEAAQLYTAESQRLSKAYETSRVIAMAKAYQLYESMYFVYQCDFRGRMYVSSAGLSPQGAKYNKALLRFREGKALGENGFYWLCVHGANCYDIDKVSFNDRVQWVVDNHQAIVQAANDPLETIDFWSDNGQPFMFLAFCFEYAEAHLDKTGYISHLPIGMDGSCNGLQNFSALLRDEVGGAATNLTPQSKPADIYTEVAVKSLELMQGKEGDRIQEWQAFADIKGGIPRKIAKRPVMTLPYGCTKYACLKFIADAVEEIQKEDDTVYFEDTALAAACYVEFLWEAIEKTVIAARAAMDWLQEVAGIMTDQDLPMWWVNPVGFPVFQDNRKQKVKRVSCTLFGDTKLNVFEAGSKLDKRKQMQSVSPNFVHSLDAAHMMKTILTAKAEGITDFAMIHDDFGTHAGNTDKFRSIIQQTFVDMYKTYTPLDDLYTSCALAAPEGTIPSLPTSGSLDINQVLESDYFFG